MNSHDPIPASAASRLSVGRIALGLAAAWFCVHVAIYVVGLCRLDPVLFKHLEHAMKHFFGWQALGFLVAAVVVGTRRPSAAGRVLGLYLLASTAVLLAFSRDVAMGPPLSKSRELLSSLIISRAFWTALPFAI